MRVQPTSELLQRHPDLVNEQRLLIAGQLLDDYPLELAQSAKSVTLLVNHAGMAQRYRQSAQENVSVQLATLPTTDEPFDTLLLYIPKAKQEAAYWLDALIPQLKADGDIFIVGENRGGINAAPKLLKNYQLASQKLDSARRCSLFYSNRNNIEHSFNLQNWLSEFELSLPQAELKVCSMPGVFNHGKLDQGTALLLQQLPTLSGKGLDFGCGAGIIAAAIAKQTDATMTALDVSVLATTSTERTMQANGLVAEVVCADGMDAIEAGFDFIVSNPPFHLGVQTEYEVSRRFIANAREKLRPKGHLWIVANSFLPYRELLESEFNRCEIVTDNGKFRIYHCQKI